MHSCRKFMLLAAVVSALASLSARAGEEDLPAARPSAVAGATAYTYRSAGGTELALNVLPATGGGGSHAAIVLFYGGAWTTGAPAQFAQQAAWLSRRGMTVVLPDYRTIGRDHATPFDAMADAASALRWVRAHAAALGIDAHRIAAGGGSAGGQLALATAILPVAGEDAAARPAALVLFNPVVETADWPRQFGARAEEASPLQRLHPGLPPTLILHGRADTTVPFAEVDRFCAAARHNGDRCELVGFDGAGHGFFNPVHGGGPGFEGTMREADRFLVSLGYLAPEHR